MSLLSSFTSTSRLAQSVIHRLYASRGAHPREMCVRAIVRRASCVVGLDSFAHLGQSGRADMPLWQIPEDRHE